MLTISVWPRRLKVFLLTHPLYKSPFAFHPIPAVSLSYFANSPQDYWTSCRRIDRES